MSNKALIGLDGFVDEVLYAVDQRFSSEKFSRLSERSENMEPEY